MRGFAMVRRAQQRCPRGPPARPRGIRSALAELEPSARGLLAVLLALLLARIAGDVAGGLELGPQLAVDLHERAGDAVADRAGLRRDAPARTRAVTADRASRAAPPPA